MRTNMQPGVSDLMGQAAQTFDTAMQAGIRFQGETMRWWSEMLQETNSIQQMQHHAQSMMTEIIPNAQRNIDQCWSLIARNCQSGIDLLRRAFEPGSNWSCFEAPQQMQELWRKSFDSLHTNTRDMVQIHMRVMEFWAGVADNNAASGAKAAKVSAQAARSSTESKAKQHAGPRRSPAQR